MPCAKTEYYKSRINVPIMRNSTITFPVSYRKSNQTLRPREGTAFVAHSRGVSLVNFFINDTGLLALILRLQNLISWPAFAFSPVNSCVLNARYLRPFSYCFYLPVVFNKHIFSRVSILHYARSPNTIFGRVAHHVVFSFDRKVFWTATHIINKVLKRIYPTNAYLYSATTIVWKAWVFFVVTASFHGLPNIVLPRVASSMFRFRARFTRKRCLSDNSSGSSRGVSALTLDVYKSSTVSTFSNNIRRCDNFPFTVLLSYIVFHTYWLLCLVSYFNITNIGKVVCGRLHILPVVLVAHRSTCFASTLKIKTTRVNTAPYLPRLNAGVSRSV